MGRVFVDGEKLKGVLMDTGWLQMTGERRIGQLTGTIRRGDVVVSVEWSTGPKVEFRGTGKVLRRGLSLDLTQYNNDRPVSETQFNLQAHMVGAVFTDPFGDVRDLNVSQTAGEWSGSYVYGPNSGLAYVTFGWDGKCDAVMANENPNDSTWSAEGDIDTDRDVLELTVNSGASKQTYRGKFKSIGPDQIQITFDREKGPFVMTLSRW